MEFVNISTAANEMRSLVRMLNVSGREVISVKTKLSWQFSFKSGSLVFIGKFEENQTFTDSARARTSFCACCFTPKRYMY